MHSTPSLRARFARLAAGITMAACLNLCGCGASIVTMFPLSPPEGATVDEDLIGTWSPVEWEENARQFVVQIGRVDREATTGAMKLSLHAIEDDGTLVQGTVRFHVTTKDGCRYINVSKRGHEREGPEYVISRYSIQDDRLLIWSRPSNDGPIREAIRNGELEGVIFEPKREPDEPVEFPEPPYQVNSAPNAFWQWLVAHDDDLFAAKTAHVFERIELPPPWPRRMSEWIILFGGIAVGIAVGIGIGMQFARLKRSAPTAGVRVSTNSA